MQALKKATTLPADVIAIDLEDAVAPAMKVSTLNIQAQQSSRVATYALKICHNFILVSSVTRVYRRKQRAQTR
jgi:citrate lyase beta subunit